MGKIVLTKELIEAGRTGPGGYTSKQMKALGVKWPGKKGWIDTLVGTTITRTQYDHFIAMSTKKRAEEYMIDPTREVSKRAKILAQQFSEQRTYDLSVINDLNTKTEK